MGKRLFVSSFARAAFAARLRSVMDERGVTLAEAAEGASEARGKSFQGQPCGTLCVAARSLGCATLMLCYRLGLRGRNPSGTSTVRHRGIFSEASLALAK